MKAAGLQPNPINRYDVIVVGSGLTGGWVAKILSEAGLKVLVLEAGPTRQAKEVHDVTAWTNERRLKAAKRQPVQSQHGCYWLSNPELFVDDIHNPYTCSREQPFLWIRGRQVGGRSLTWGGLTLRFSDYEFRAADRDGYGTSWPLKHSDLAASYEEVEKYLHVQGSREHLDQLPDGCFAPPPPLTAAEVRLQTLIESKWTNRRVIVARGLPLEHERNHLQAEEWRPTANLSNTLFQALATGRTTIRADSIVSRLIIDNETGRAKGVTCIDRITHAVSEVFGRIVILCASTIESVRLLLNSKCQRHPRGVGNSSGYLGRCLMDHLVVGVAGTVEPHMPESSLCPLGGAHGILIPRFRNITDVSDNFLRGYGLWGGAHRGPKGSHLGSSWFLNALIEVIPQEENCVEIDESRLDAWGIPVPRIKFKYSENELKLKADAEACIAEMCHIAQLNIQWRGQTLPGQYVHELGGARMGVDPSSSVLSPFNQCWDAKNLFVLDGSCFVTSGWQNPSLTMMALAVRASTNIVSELRAGSL